MLAGEGCKRSATSIIRKANKQSSEVATGSTHPNHFRKQVGGLTPQLLRFRHHVQRQGGLPRRLRPKDLHHSPLQPRQQAVRPERARNTRRGAIEH